MCKRFSQRVRQVSPNELGIELAYVYGGTHDRISLGSRSTCRIHQWVNLTSLKLIVLNLGFKTNIALLSL